MKRSAVVTLKGLLIITPGYLNSSAHQGNVHRKKANANRQTMV